MDLEINGTSGHSEKQDICFSESMDWQSLQVISDDVTIVPISGNHRTGSSQIKVKNIVDSAWERTFHWGNLVTTHRSGQYFAYALTVPGKAAGMVRVLRSHCSDRIILKGFQGFVRDLSFAYHDKRILVAAVDEYGYLLVHEIIGAEVKLVLQVNPESPSSSSENHRVIWCPYVPDKDNDIIGEEMSDDSNDHALLLAASHNNKVEIWHLGLVNGLFTYQSATIGVMLIEHFEKAVVDIAFSPDSTAVAVASLDGTVCFFTVNIEKKEPRLLHQWKPHGDKPLSGVIFLDDLSNPSSESPLWKWAITSAEHNTEFKLWSCEQWECHQTIRFQSSDTSLLYQKMALDLSASFLLVSDIHRKVLYVMHIEQIEDEGISKITSVTQLLLPFSAISLAIRQASLKPLALHMGTEDDDFCGDGDSSRVIMKMLVVQPKSVQKCKAVFQLGTSSPLGEGGIGSSFSQTSTSMNTTVSEYDAAAATSTASKVSTNHIDLLTPDAFVSPAKSSNINNQADSASVKRSIAPSPVTPASMPLPPPTPNEILALSSPRRPTPDVTSSTTPKRNGIQSGGSSPSREVEEILGTRPLTEGSVESPDTSSATVPSGSALQDVLAAYPSSLSPAFMRTASSKEASPVLDRYKSQPIETANISSAAGASPSRELIAEATPANGNLLDELFAGVLTKSPDKAPQPTITATTPAATWPNVLPPLVQSRPKEQRVQDRSDGDLALQNIQQTLSQLVNAFSAQQTENQRLRTEVAQLRSDLHRIESAQTVGTAKPQWLPQLEATLTRNFDRQQKKLEEMNAPNKTNQVVSELQSTIRSEFENKAHSLEQRTVDFIRKELQSVVASQMSRMEPVLKGSTLQLLTSLAQNKVIIDTYSQATAAVAASAMHKTCKDVFTQQMLPSVERSFAALFTQLNETFSKGINDFVRTIENQMERNRRLQEKESAAQLNATLDKMRTVFDQARESAATETKNELRKIAHDIPEHVGNRLIPAIHAELQRISQDQKAALDGALMAVQQVTQSQSRAPTPAVGPSTPMLLQAQLKQLISQGQLCEAFQRALSVSDLNMVLFLCERVDAQRLFSTTPCVLPQPVLLSLIQQLSADLGTATELKLNYLQEAVCAVDLNDPVTKEHAPTVMSQLVRQLQTQVSAYGSGALSSQIRLLLLAAQRLQKA